MKKLIIGLFLFAFTNSIYALSYSVATKAARMNAISTQIGGGGYLTIYSGIQPATCGTATTALAIFTLGSPFAPTTSTNVIYPNLPANATVIANGTASWFRITTSGGTCVVDGTVATSGADMNLPMLSFSTGLVLVMPTFSMTSGN